MRVEWGVAPIFRNNYFSSHDFPVAELRKTNIRTDDDAPLRNTDDVFRNPKKKMNLISGQIFVPIPTRPRTFAPSTGCLFTLFVRRPSTKSWIDVVLKEPQAKKDGFFEAGKNSTFFLLTFCCTTRVLARWWLVKIYVGVLSNQKPAACKQMQRWKQNTHTINAVHYGCKLAKHATIQKIQNWMFLPFYYIFVNLISFQAHHSFYIQMFHTLAGVISKVVRNSLGDV